MWKCNETYNAIILEFFQFLVAHIVRYISHLNHRTWINRRKCNCYYSLLWHSAGVDLSYYLFTKNLMPKIIFGANSFPTPPPPTQRILHTMIFQRTHIGRDKCNIRLKYNIEPIPSYVYCSISAVRLICRIGLYTYVISKSRRSIMIIQSDLIARWRTKFIDFKM